MPANTVTPPQASAWEWAQASLVALNLVWTTLSLGGYRPETMVVTSGLTGALVLVHFLHRACTSTSLPPIHPAGWLLLPFVVYAAANVIWVSPVKWLGWMDWWGWAQMIAVFWVVLNGIHARGPRRALFSALIAVALAAVLMGCYQRFIDPEWLMMGRTQALQFHGRASGPFGIPNSLAALLLLLLPAVMALTFHRRASETERVWWGWVTVVLLIGLMLTISRGAWIALALALVAWPLLRTDAGWRRRLVAATCALMVVALGISLLLAFAPKTRERFELIRRDAGELSRPIMWRAGWNIFREAPVVGTGAGSYNVRFEAYRPEQFTSDPQWAHNDYLHTLSDYGVVGFMFFFGAVITMALICRAGRRDAGRSDPHWLDRRQTVGGIAVGILAFGLQLFVEFHFKIAALAMAFATLGALVVGRTWPVPQAAMKPALVPRVLAAVAGLGFGGIVAFAIIPLFRGESLRYRARQSIDQAVKAGSVALDPAMLERAQNDLAAAVLIYSRNAQAWADLSLVTTLRGESDRDRDGELGVEAEAAAEAALALCPVHHEFWIRRGIARDMQGRWFEAGNDFARALAIAPSNGFAWYHQAYHLSRMHNQLALAEAALAFCLRLDPGNPSALALRQQLAIMSEAP